MQEIKCPNCGEVFQVDESDYAQIVKQVRDQEFSKEIDRRIKELETRRDSDIKMAKMEQEKKFSDDINELNKKITEKEASIEKLKLKISNTEVEKQLAVTEAVKAKEQELSDKNTKITELMSQLNNKDTERELKEKNLKENYEAQLKAKDEQIEYYKDFKTRMSTKMVGESLEQHCLNQFNMIRMTAFPNAYFEKDNDAKSGSKGDFIFREASEDGTEFISIMFEMKNETETTSKKHKNEDFFKELDKDRREKGCEYAVLVSLLEGDSELYNNGIVDVSYKYEKMYVIRPQFFIPMITLLRNAALNSLKYQQELQIVRNQQVDIMNFESNLNSFKDGFARNYRLASEKFNLAIEEIDKTIDHLTKTKNALLSSENNLRLANNKAEDLSIKKLTKNAPSVKAMFDDAGKKEN
ncbi:MAG: DUF2130 domain-containing protein [Lachnospiraceae bacterium]|nr:DUF2130 domain-containing protein [Lachnospiraceae bacterium]